MGTTESGETGTRPPVKKKKKKNSWGRLASNYDKYDSSATFFRDTHYNFAFSNIFQIKCPKTDEKLKVGMGAYGAVPPPPTNQNFVAAPLTTLLYWLPDTCWLCLTYLQGRRHRFWTGGAACPEKGPLAEGALLKVSLLLYHMM